MRKVKLSAEKHVLPTKLTPMVEHDAEVLFTLHDEATEVIISYYRAPKRNIFKVRELIKAMQYCQSKMRSDLKAEHDIEGKLFQLSDALRVSALDRLLKVDRELDLILTSNPL